MGGVLECEESELGEDGAHAPRGEVPRDQMQLRGITYDEMIPGRWQLVPRLADMDRNHTASSCFSSWMRFCDQHLSEGQDKDLGLRCIPDHISFCVLQDKVAFEKLDTIPVENITYNVDYPHRDSTWPNSLAIAERHMAKLTQEQVDLIVHDNAVRLFGLTPEGHWRR